MAWPWISAATHRQIVGMKDDEIIFLRHQVATMLEHRVRVERREVGLPEIQPTIKPPDEEIPEKVRKVISLYADSRTRTALVHSCRAARRMDPPKSWDGIYTELCAAIPPDALRGLDQPTPDPEES